MDGNFAGVLAEALGGALGDASRFKCAPFKGGKDENIESFFDKYNMWCETNGKNEAYKIENFRSRLDGRAYTLYESLSDEIKANYDLVKDAMKTYFAPTQLPAVQGFEKLRVLKMDPGETVQTFFEKVMQWPEGEVMEKYLFCK